MVLSIVCYTPFSLMFYNACNGFILTDWGRPTNHGYLT